MTHAPINKKKLTDPQERWEVLVLKMGTEMATKSNVLGMMAPIPAADK
jgi:hypothetical protein